MNTIMELKYTGDGGNAQRMFIKDSKTGWKAILADPNRHLSNGVTQYDFVETFGKKLGGQARQVLDNYLDKWDHTNEDNPNYEAGLPVSREASREVWRSFYKRKAVFDSRQIQVATGGKVPLKPDALEDPVEEHVDLNEFLAIIRGTFQSASTVYLEACNFESFVMLCHVSQ